MPRNRQHSQYHASLWGMFDTPRLECTAEPLSFSFLSCWNFHMFREGLRQGDRGQSQQLKGDVATQLGDSVCALYYTID